MIKWCESRTWSDCWLNNYQEVDKLLSGILSFVNLNTFIPTRPQRCLPDVLTENALHRRKFKGQITKINPRIHLLAFSSQMLEQQNKK